MMNGEYPKHSVQKTSLILYMGTRKISDHEIEYCISAIEAKEAKNSLLLNIIAQKLKKWIKVLVQSHRVCTFFPCSKTH